MFGVAPPEDSDTGNNDDKEKVKIICGYVQ